MTFLGDRSQPVVPDSNFLVNIVPVELILIIIVIVSIVIHLLVETSSSGTKDSMASLLN